MNQDGKSEQRADMAQSSSSAPVTSPGGKVLLTLCTSPEDAAPYRHATVRFPSSYQAACATALKVFTAYIPPNVEAVSLRQVMHRKDSQRVWSIVPEDDWDVCLEKQGEEVGVFLPDMIPETVPYRKMQPAKKIAYFQCDYRLPLLVPRAVNSLEDCVKFAEELSIKHEWDRFALYYDERMMGTEADQKLYRSRINTYNKSPTWRLLDNAETFNVLRDLLPEPMWIKVDPW